MGAVTQNRPSDWFLMNGGPGCVYHAESLTTAWSAPAIITGGVGDQMRCASGGGVVTWYNGDLGTGESGATRYAGDRRTGEARGILGVPNGEGDREWYSTLNEYRLVPSP